MVKQATLVLNSFCSNAAKQFALFVARLTPNHSRDLGNLGKLVLRRTQVAARQANVANTNFAVRRTNAFE